MRIEISLDGAPLGSPILRLDLFLAADRPDRLEVSTARRAPVSPSPRARAAVTVRWDGAVLFTGELERSGQSIDPLHGGAATLVAYSRYHSLRSAALPHRWHQSTDSEAVERLASALELSPSVERTIPVHAVLERRGDPLRFLRARARACGFQLAVCGGRLYFSRELPAQGETIQVSRESNVISLDLEERHRSGGTLLGGSLEIVGDVRWKPLVPLDLNGLDGRGRGRYRSVRAMHALDPEGYRTRVEFVEEGCDYALWREQDSESEVLDIEE